MPQFWHALVLAVTTPLSVASFPLPANQVPRVAFSALLIAGLGITWVVRALGEMRTEIQVANTALSQIGALALGRVAVCGRAGGSFSEAPFSGEPCLLARSEIWVREGKNMSHVATVTTPPQPTFTVSDATGAITVVADQALLDGVRQVFDPVGSPSAAGDALLTAWGVDPTRREVRVIERRLPVDETVYVCGVALDGAMVGTDERGVERAVPLPAGTPVIAPRGGTKLYVALGERADFIGRLRWRVARDLGGGGLVAIAGLALLAWASVAGVSASDPRMGAALAAGDVRAIAAHARRVDLDRRDDAGTTALMRAARSGDAATIARLVGSGADPDAIDPADRTALDYAILAGSEPAARALLAARPMLGLQDHQGESALHLAAARGEPAIVRELLAAGADPTTVDAHDRTPLALARASHAPHRAEVTQLLTRALRARP